MFTFDRRPRSSSGVSPAPNPPSLRAEKPSREMPIWLRQLASRTASAASSEHGKAPEERAAPASSSAGREHEADRTAAAVLACSESPTLTLDTAPKTAPTAAGPAADIKERAAAQDGVLPASTRTYMEQRFGHDFSRVLVATDHGADQVAHALGARAFTVGDTIAFAKGEFSPHTEGGRRLLAHELTHVTQQRESSRAEVALQPAPALSLLDQVRDIRGELSAPTSPVQHKSVVAKALALADSLIAALEVARLPNAPTGGNSAQDIRDALIELVRGLAFNGDAEAAQKVVVKSKDPEIKNLVLIELQNHSDGVAEQQSMLGKVAPLVDEKIAPPAKGETSKQWLDKNTSAIGRTFKKLDQEGLPGLNGVAKGPYDRPENLELGAGLEMTHRLMDQIFTHAPADVSPDPLGKVGHLNLDSTNDKVEVDCDVYATFGARLLREQGWDTAGYLLIAPEDKKPNSTDTRDAHLAVMARKKNSNGGFHYVAVSNELVRDLSIFSSDENARFMLMRLALEVYSPTLTSYKVYYQAAGSNGALDMKLLNPVANSIVPFFRAP